MYSLVYQSVASSQLRPEDLEELLVRARKFNRSQEITGCLLFFRDIFIQYLEGSQVRVLALYDQIRKDPRHSAVRLLAHGQVDKREFPNWDMAYENLYGDNEMINYIKLVVSDYLENPKKRAIPRPASDAFWEQVSRLLARQQPDA